MLLGKGDGTFADQSDYATATYPQDVAVGDFNADGRLDLAVPTGANSVSVLLGTTQSTCTPPTVTSPNGGESWLVGSAHAITWTAGTGVGATITISRDGGSSWIPIADLWASSNSYSWTVSGPETTQAMIKVTNSAGSDTSNAAFTIGSPPTVTSPNGGETWPVGSAHVITWTAGSGTGAAIAISRDGGSSWNDIVSGLANSGSYSWTVSGPATTQTRIKVTTSVGSDTSNAVFTIAAPGFATHVDYATGTNPCGFAIGDFNADGKQDLATADVASNTVSVLLGNGHGTFRPKVDLATAAGPEDVAVGDFNADGKQDLVTADWASNTVSVLLGKGDGSFQPHVDYASGSGSFQVAVGDVNADGKQDLVTADWGSNTVSVLLGNGDGTFQPKVDYATAAGPEDVAVGDFNADGKLDLAVPTDANTVSVLLGNGNGTFAARHDYATGTSPYSVKAADLNGDGTQDLVTAKEQGS